MNLLEKNPLLFSILVVIAVVTVVLSPIFSYLRIKKKVDVKTAKKDTLKYLKIPFGNELVPLYYGYKYLGKKVSKYNIQQYLLNWIVEEKISIEKSDYGLISIRFKGDSNIKNVSENQLYYLLLKYTDLNNYLTLEMLDNVNLEFFENLKILFDRIGEESREYFQFHSYMDDNGNLNEKGLSLISELDSIINFFDENISDEKPIKYDNHLWDQYVVLMSAIDESLKTANLLLNFNIGYKYDTFIKGDGVSTDEALNYIKEFSDRVIMQISRK